MEKETKVNVGDLRAKHLNNKVYIEGKLVYASDVRPQAVNAKFRCPSCETIISVLQIERKFREPTRCPCGRKRGFILINKQVVDAQRIVVEDFPGKKDRSQSHISVFLKEGLTDSELGIADRIGSRIEVSGTLMEVPTYLETGEMSVRFDLAIDAEEIKLG